ncbi:hypothetical protein MesoLj113a_27010 [Mesorhizobium sp. 113-1-2]|uniref:hypothetical protein n=1 Tax=Mesorhizobium sp. 113-1-2 TaxID=2744515 RepID=UPI001927934A|nr:hypothetical protein [Mesorhizobium sp. 113-1-2]BCG71543.1 hypothetical protein MesoLj113a_27010 [Mesorhizobium sp. 113-1-2]
MRKNTNLHAADEALEDAADVAIYDERKAELKTEKALPADMTWIFCGAASRTPNWRRFGVTSE